MTTRDVAEGIAAIATLARWAGLRVVPTCEGIEIHPPDDEEREKWLADCAAECRCCSRCADVPCGGIMQGAVCDELCSCHDDWPDDYRPEMPDWSDDEGDEP